VRGLFFRSAVVGSLTAALVLGASAALAGTGVGGVFNLGQSNTVNQTSSLSGSSSGAQLTVANSSTAVGANGLRVNGAAASSALVAQNSLGAAATFNSGSSKPPFFVNSNVQVPSLNSSLLGGHAASFYLPASTVRRLGPTTIAACNPAQGTCDSSGLITIGQLTFSKKCISNPNPMGEEDAILYVASSAAHSAVVLVTTTGAQASQPDMSAGTSYLLADAFNATVGTPELAAVSGETLSADGHEISFTLYAGQNLRGASDGRCVFGGTLVVQ
jgi:hypothetical protein